MKKAILLATAMVAMGPACLSANIMSMLTNPASPTKAVQFNFNGVFRGTPTFTYDPGTSLLSVTSLTVTGSFSAPGILATTGAFVNRPTVTSTPLVTAFDLSQSTSPLLSIINYMLHKATADVMIAALSASTANLALGLDRKMATVIIGTSATNGAHVIGTTTEVFGFAISSAGGLNHATSAYIWVQDGDYFWTQVSCVPPNVTIEFAKGAWVKSNNNYAWNSVFWSSGTIINPQIDFSTSGIENTEPLYRPFHNSKLIGGTWKVDIAEFTQNAGVAQAYGIEWDERSQNTMVRDLEISTYTHRNKKGAGTSASVSLFRVEGGTNNVVDNISVNGEETGQSNTTRPMWAMSGQTFAGGSIIGFQIRNSRFKNYERFMAWDGTANGVLVRGFDFRNNYVENFQDPTADGLIQLQNSGTVNYSSGNAIVGNRFYHRCATSLQTIETFGSIGGWYISFNQIWHDRTGNSGGGINLAGSSNNMILIGNFITGTTDCITNAGTNNKVTGNLNYCNQTAQ